jgi:hypothetical protein
MQGASEMLRSLQSTLDECLVDDHLACYIRQFTSLPGFDLLSYRLEVALHRVHTNRDAVDERERLQVLRQCRCEHAGDNVPGSGPEDIRSPRNRLPARLALPPSTSGFPINLHVMERVGDTEHFPVWARTSQCLQHQRRNHERRSGHESD